MKKTTIQMMTDARLLVETEAGLRHDVTCVIQQDAEGNRTLAHMTDSVDTLLTEGLSGEHRGDFLWKDNRLTATNIAVLDGLDALVQDVRDVMEELLASDKL